VALTVKNFMVERRRLEHKVFSPEGVTRARKKDQIHEEG
jgi:hypothetical protein